MNHPTIFYIEIAVTIIADIGIIFLCFSIYKSRKFIRQCKAYNAAVREYNLLANECFDNRFPTKDEYKYLEELRSKADSLKPDDFDNF